MARTEEQVAEISAMFPYQGYMNHPAWSVIEKALNELISNNDLEIHTPPRYIIGFLIKALTTQGVETPSIVQTNSGEKTLETPLEPGVEKNI